MGGGKDEKAGRDGARRRGGGAEGGEVAVIDIVEVASASTRLSRAPRRRGLSDERGRRGARGRRQRRSHRGSGSARESCRGGGGGPGRTEDAARRERSRGLPRNGDPGHSSALSRPPARSFEPRLSCRKPNPPWGLVDDTKGQEVRLPGPSHNETPGVPLQTKVEVDDRWTWGEAEPLSTDVERQGGVEGRGSEGVIVVIYRGWETSGVCPSRDDNDRDARVEYGHVFAGIDGGKWARARLFRKRCFRRDWVEERKGFRTESSG